MSGAPYDFQSVFFFLSGDKWRAMALLLYLFVTEVFLYSNIRGIVKLLVLVFSYTCCCNPGDSMPLVSHYCQIYKENATSSCWELLFFTYAENVRIRLNLGIIRMIYAGWWNINSWPLLIYEILIFFIIIIFGKVTHTLVFLQTSLTLLNFSGAVFPFS